MILAMPLVDAYSASKFGVSFGSYKLIYELSELTSSNVSSAVRGLTQSAGKPSIFTSEVQKIRRS